MSVRGDRLLEAFIEHAHMLRWLFPMGFKRAPVSLVEDAGLFKAILLLQERRISPVVRCSRNSSPLAARKTLRNTLQAEHRDSRARSSSTSGQSMPATMLFGAWRPGAQSKSLKSVRAEVRLSHTASSVRGTTCHASRNVPKVYTRRSGIDASCIALGAPSMLLQLSVANVCKHPLTRNFVVAVACVGASRPEPWRSYPASTARVNAFV